MIENHGRITINPNSFLTSRKNYMNLNKNEESAQSDPLSSFVSRTERPDQLALSFRFRHPEYTMPDCLRTSAQASREQAELLNPVSSLQSLNGKEGQTAALLSKHNGWITVDSNCLRRSEAPECYQSTNPLQRNKQRPSWLVDTVNSSIEQSRY